MTKRLEETFNLPSFEDDIEDAEEELAEGDEQRSIVSIEDAISVSEKINMALNEVRGMEEHDDEMDAIAKQAVESYEQLMQLGMNISDMAAGKVFDNAASMLKVALDAKDSKVNRKLKQVDLLLKKARLDQQALKSSGGSVEGPSGDTEQAFVFDRNDILKMVRDKKNDE